MRRFSLVSALILILAASMALFVVVNAQNQAAKPSPEGLGGQTGRGQLLGTQPPDKTYLEGEGGQAAGSRTSALSPEGKLEGQAGPAGQAHGEGLHQKAAPEGGLAVIFRFSGATDDGEQGSANRREATTIHCTNIDPVLNAQVEVQIYQWDGNDVYTGTVTMPPNRTFAFSTQNTTIYFDDVILGGGPGTDAIFQGSGQVWSSHRKIICTAQTLDPLNYPPLFVTSLELFKE